MKINKNYVQFVIYIDICILLNLLKTLPITSPLHIYI